MQQKKTEAFASVFNIINSEFIRTCKQDQN